MPDSTRPAAPRSDVDRRTFLVGSLAAGSLATPMLGGAPAYAGPRKAAAGNPFTLGVASGDPAPDGFVLWTRLAVDPLAEDGRGGMPSKPVTVQWQLSADERFGKIVRAGRATALPEWGHSVHVELDSLPSGRDYWYRFRVGRHLSPAGLTRTAPAAGAMVDALRMAFVSCSQYEHGFFTAYRHLAEENVDLVLHLGDYQYEYRAGNYVVPTGNPRDHEGPETETLANYRQRHAQYKTDPDLQAAHASAPWLVVWDDHELDNNWADEVPEKPEIPQPNFRQRRAAAFRGYYENMPLRRTSVPKGIDMQLYRRISWGRLATFHMLDTRQFRDDQGCGDQYAECPEATDPNRTITGAQQEEWLLEGFRESHARWDLLGQQVFFAQRDNDEGPTTVTSQDAWDGYVASRERITRGWLDTGVRNPVMLTGDVHAHWASDLKLDYADPTTKTVGSELVCSSITSGGDGEDWIPEEHPFLKINPHLRFYNNLRGYVSTTITADQIDAEFRCVPYVSEQGAEVFTRASFAIEDRKPGVHQTADHPMAGTSGKRRTMAEKSDREIIDRTVAWETERP